MALTPTLLPPPLSLPEVAPSTSQGLFGDTDQETGRAQAPLSLIPSDCEDEVCPSGTEIVRFEGGCSVHGACTVKETVNDCGLLDSC